MGLSLTSALIGFGILLIGVTLLVVRKQRKIAIALFIIGIALMVAPYTYIYFFVD